MHYEEIHAGFPAIFRVDQRQENTAVANDNEKENGRHQDQLRNLQRPEVFINEWRV